MPTSYVVIDSTNSKYVSAYTDTTNYSETTVLGLVPIRIQSECDSIVTHLNAVEGAGKFGTHIRPH